MDKKKKIIIISAVAAVFVIAAILLVIFMGKNKYITISFDSNGAKKIEAQKIKKGETIKLPTVTKEGYKFTGWYNGNEKVSKYTKYDKNTTLKAKWLSEDAKTFTIKFDSDGGSKVDDLIIECDKELTLPESPTKEGYKFVSWIDKNDTPILDKALLTCEDITLKAKWEKEEITSTKKESSKTTTTTTSKKAEKQKVYKCPEGYTLSGTKCTKTDVVSADKSCSRGTVHGTSCVIQLPEQDPTWTCPENYSLQVGYVPGNGYKVCADRYGSTQTIAPKCSRDRTYDATSHMCTGLAKVGDVVYSCNAPGYTLDGETCVKTTTIDATLE